jgi:5-formyltetrahydrofolate cyclo-ligase
MKEQLRDQARKIRDKLHDPAKGLGLRDNFLGNIEIAANSVIAAYWPTGSEIDVKPLMFALYDQGHNLCLPCIVNEGGPLIFRRWQPETVMVKSRFRIYEPCKQEEEVTPTMLITPLLAFDKLRHRVGYGGGYYDRTLQKLKEENGNALNITTIGVAYNGQEVEKIPNQDWDVQLDKIVTEVKVFS